MHDEFLSKIPSLETLQNRFAFIKNDTLRENVTIYTRYIIFMLALSEEDNLDSLKYTVYKDIIIFTASIVESILQYTVNRYITEGKASTDIFGLGTKYEQIGQISHDCDDLYKAKLCTVKITKVPKFESGDEISFNDINKAARNAKILDEKLFSIADKLRDRRNTIHIQKLTKSSDDYFDKSDVEDAFKSANKIVARCEAILGSLA